MLLQNMRGLIGCVSSQWAMSKPICHHHYRALCFLPPGNTVSANYFSGIWHNNTAYFQVASGCFFPLGHAGDNRRTVIVGKQIKGAAQPADCPQPCSWSSCRGISIFKSARYIFDALAAIQGQHVNIYCTAHILAGDNQLSPSAVNERIASCFSDDDAEFSVGNFVQSQPRTQVHSLAASFSH